MVEARTISEGVRRGMFSFDQMREAAELMTG
jgi:hypothetical protein